MAIVSAQQDGLVRTVNSLVHKADMGQDANVSADVRMAGNVIT